MELNQLNYFRVVARLENMTKAAAELYISQPNLSTSISRLESNLGIQLFQRTRGHIYLTEGGLCRAGGGGIPAPGGAGI